MLKLCSPLVALVLLFSLVVSALPLSSPVEATEGIDRSPEMVVFIDLKDLNTEFRAAEYSQDVDTRQAYAEQTQQSIIKFLTKNGAEILNTFWLDNGILAKVNPDTILKLRSFAEVEAIFPNFAVTIPELQESQVSISQNVTWGLERIRASEVWNLGIDGTGIRIAVIDTGVDITHPDLAGKMWTDDSADLTYPGGWIEFDENGAIVANSVPHDTHGHGTHTSGTAVGGDASGVAIGVAPGAWLMHALALPQGEGTFAQVLTAMEWTIEPFDHNGDPAGAPADVVSMSWGAYGYWEELIQPIENMKAAGIVPVAAIGNEGERASSSPGNVYDSFGIGAMDKYDDVPSWSSGEEIHWSESSPEPYIKPDFTAPGVDVYSSVPWGWEYWSGTSVSTPHVAGTVALMLEANLGLTVDEIYQKLGVTADDLGEVGKDTRYGWGVIDAYDAVTLDSGVEGYVTDSETGQPVEGAEILVEETGQSVSSDAAGFYKTYLYPGTYTLTARAFGYYEKSAPAVVAADAFTSQGLALEPMPTGSIAGTVSDGETGDFIAGATITVPDTPLNAMSDENGDYSLAAPVGTYDVKAVAEGYLESTVFGVSVTESETSTVNFALQPFLVAVMGDYFSQLSDLLGANGITAEERDWGIIDDISQYDAVVVSLPDDPGKNTFLSFLDAAAENGVGVVFTSSYGAGWESYGISLLEWYLSDPEWQDYDFGAGVVFYEITFPHPIFAGWEVGDTINIIDGGDQDYAWFGDYSGLTVGNISADFASRWWGSGEGVAFSLSDTNAHLLLAGLAPQVYTSVPNWTAEGKEIFVRGVKWVAQPFLPLSLSRSEGYVGDDVEISGSGATANGVMQVYGDMTLFNEILADSEGNFSLSLTIPETPGGVYNITAVDQTIGALGMEKFEVNPALYAEPAAGTAGDEVMLGGTGFASEAEVFLYYNGAPLEMSETSELGSFSVVVTIPFITLPGSQQIWAVDGEGNIARRAFTAANATITSIEGNVATIQTDIGTIQTDVSHINATITSIEGNVATIQTDVGTIQTDVSHINATITGIEGGVATIQTDVGTIQTDVSHINATITSIEGDVATIQTDVGTIKTLMSNINGRVTTIEGNVATIETDIGTIKADISDLKGQIETPEMTINKYILAIAALLLLNLLLSLAAIRRR